MKKAAHIISYLFIPLLAPVYAMLVAMYVQNYEDNYFQPNCLFFLQPEAKYAILYLFVTFSFIAPALTIVILYLRGTISGMMLENRKERILPSILVNLFGFGLFLCIWRMVPFTMPGYRFVYGLSLGSSLTVLLCTIVTFRWKISLHAAGMGILTGFVFTYFYHMLEFSVPLMAGLFVLSGLVMSARMVLKAHSLAQLFYGYLAGFSITMVSCFSFFIR